MELGYAAQSLEPLSPDHIAARKGTDLAGLQAMAVDRSLELLRLVLNSHGGNARADEIAAALCGSVIPEANWKRWWEQTKRAAKRDGHFTIPTQKTKPISLRSESQTPDEALLESFRNRHGLKEKIALAQQWHQNQAQFDPQHPMAKELTCSIAEMLERHPPRHVAVALEAIWLLQDFGSASPMPPDVLSLRARNVISAAPDLAAVVQELPAAKLPRLLALVRDHLTNWIERLLALTNEIPARCMDEIVDFLLKENQAVSLGEFFVQSVQDHSARSDLLLWLAKNRGIEKYQPVIMPALNPRFLATVFGAIEQDAIDSPRKNRHPLREFLSRDEKLIEELLSQISEEDARQLAERTARSSSIDEPTKRSLLGRFIKIFPSLQPVLVSTAPAKVDPLYVSAESLERRQAEYDDLINKQIPQNAREIAIARGYGDLSENHEFKSAKEQQALLQRRKAETERDLANARLTDFDVTTADTVAMGTRVATRSDSSDAEHEYTIMGAWDSDPANGIISYLSPIAKALMNKRVGDEADVEVDSAKHRVKIIRIAPWKAAATVVATGNE